MSALEQNLVNNQSYYKTNAKIETPLVNKDGKIGSTCQGKDKNDCWLLSSINALNSTEDGQELISNILEYHNDGDYEDGYTIVHLELGDYKVTDIEVANARDNAETSVYATGDDDMIIMELAAEKALDSIGEDFAYDIYTPEYVEDIDSGSTESSIDSGNFEKAMYMLTGKAATAYKTRAIIKDGEVISKENGIDKAIELYTTSTSDAKVMNASIEKRSATYLTNLNDNSTVKLAGNHQYSIKDISNGEVTIVNPWNSGNDIKISLEDFKNTFTQIEYIDLNEANNDRCYMTDEYTTDGTNKSFTFNYKDGTGAKKTYTNGELTSVTYLDNNKNATTKVNYENGKAANSIEYNNDGTKSIYLYNQTDGEIAQRVNIDKNGNVSYIWNYNSETSKWESAQTDAVNLSSIRDIVNSDIEDSKDNFNIKNGSNGKELTRLDKDGEPEETSSVVLSDEEYSKLSKTDLLKYSQFTPSEIQILLQAEEKDLAAALEFLAINTDAEFEAIEKYIEN